MKFGGSSLRDAAAILRVTRLVEAAAARRPLVVVSAHGGVTRALERLATAATLGVAEPDRVAERHLALLSDLGLPGDVISPLLSEMASALGALRGCEVGAAERDAIMAFGERLAARVVAAAFRAAGLDARARDSFDLGLITDDAHQSARPLPGALHRLAAHAPGCRGIAVVTGFIGRNEDGRYTTLGRNGSDYSAALFASAWGAAELEIWTDVDGVLTADPGVVAEARTVPWLSHSEALELARLGDIFHVGAIHAAADAGIPIHVRNTFRPAARGTVISDRPPPAGGGGLKAVVSRPDATPDVALVGIVGACDPELARGRIGRALAKTGIPTIGELTAGPCASAVRVGASHRDAALRALHSVVQRAGSKGESEDSVPGSQDRDG